MDTKNIEHRLKIVDMDSHLDEVYDRRSRAKEYEQLIQQYGQEVADKYISCAERFRIIFNTAGYAQSGHNEKTSTEIQLGEHTLDHLGSGKLVAVLSTNDEVAELLSVDTTVSFVDQQGSQHHIDSENFWTVGFTFGGGHDFLEDHHKWSRKELEGANDYYNRDVGTVIYDAEQTLDLLENALGIASKTVPQESLA